MHVKKDKAISKSIIVMFLFVCAVAVFLGLSIRPLVSKAAAPEDATLTDAREQLSGFQSAAQVATPSDVDRSPYLTNDVTILQTNDLLLSIRNILVCIWWTIILIWTYDRMKAIICRVSGGRKHG